MAAVKRLSKKLVGQVLFKSGLDGLLLRDRAVVVAFHRVNDGPGEDGLSCHHDMFDRYCRFFARHFTVVRLNDLVRRLEQGQPVNRELAITFDDGYRDNFQYAAPILKRRGLPATFFVVTGFIGSEFVPSWDRRLSRRHPWMSWEQVRWLQREGFEIGAHTRTHVDLGEVGGERAREEIEGSRRDLEDKLAVPVELFAYPFGREDQISEGNRKIIKTAGFRCCCSCFGGVNPRGTDPFYMRRVPISSWFTSPEQFGCEVALRRA